METLKNLYRSPPRRDAGGAGGALRRERRWTRPQGGLFIWATLDERIDTTDLLALARTSEGVAFVPGRAAYMDGRSGSSSMRLNFAGIAEADIREGIRRIGKAIGEQVGLLGSLTGSGAAGARSGRSDGEQGADSEGAPLADVVALPRRQDSARGRRRQDR